MGALIEKFQAMDVDTLKKEIEEAQAKIDKIAAKSQKAIDGITEKITAEQKNLEAEKKKKNDLVAKETKKTGVGIMKKIVTAHQKKEKKEDKGGKGKRKKAAKSDL